MKSIIILLMVYGALEVLAQGSDLPFDAFCNQVLQQSEGKVASCHLVLFVEGEEPRGKLYGQNEALELDQSYPIGTFYQLAASVQFKARVLTLGFRELRVAPLIKQYFHLNVVLLKAVFFYDENQGARGILILGYPKEIQPQDNNTVMNLAKLVQTQVLEFHNGLLNRHILYGNLSPQYIQPPCKGDTQQILLCLLERTTTRSPGLGIALFMVIGVGLFLFRKTDNGHGYDLVLDLWKKSRRERFEEHLKKKEEEFRMHLLDIHQAQEVFADNTFNSLFLLGIRTNTNSITEEFVSLAQEGRLIRRDQAILRIEGMVNGYWEDLNHLCTPFEKGLAAERMQKAKQVLKALHDQMTQALVSVWSEHHGEAHNRELNALFDQFEHELEQEGEPLARKMVFMRAVQDYQQQFIASLRQDCSELLRPLRKRTQRQIQEIFSRAVGSVYVE